MGTFYNPDRDLDNIRKKYPRQVKHNGHFIAGKFMRFLLASGLDKKRVVKLCRYAKVISTWLDKPFEELTMDDIEEFLAKVNVSDYSEWAKLDLKLTMRKILKCLEKSELDCFTLTIKRNREKLPNVLKEEQIVRMVEIAQEHEWRDAALLGLAYETAARPGELQGMRVGDVKETPYGYKVALRGKTGERRLPVVLFASTLKKWLMIHPFGNREDAPLFCSLATNYLGTPLSYRHFVRIFKRYAKLAGIREITPYTFRHTRLTELAKHMTEAELCEFAGWIQGSKMARVYVHLSARDIESKYLQIYGLKEKETVNTGLSIVKCMRCGEINSKTEKFCVRCQYPLTSEAARKVITSDAYKEELKALIKEILKQ